MVHSIILLEVKQLREIGITLLNMNYLHAAIHVLSSEPVGVVVNPRLLNNYEDADFILDRVNKYDGTSIGRFAYNPKTNELVWGPISERHAIMIHNFAHGKFDDFVRGFYSKPTGNIIIRWYSSDPYMPPEEIRSHTYNAWFDVKEMLEKNGLPGNITVAVGAGNEFIKNELGLSRV